MTRTRTDRASEPHTVRVSTARPTADDRYTFDV